MPIESRRAWTRRSRRVLLVSDTVAVLAAVGMAHLRLAAASPDPTLTPDGSPVRLGYEIVSVAVVAAWIGALGANRSRGRRLLSDLPGQLRSVVVASCGVFGAFGVLSYLLRLEVGRGYLLTALPLGLLLLCLGRAVRWSRLRSKRRERAAVYRTVLVGRRDSVAHVADRLSGGVWGAHELVGVVTPGLVDDERVTGVQARSGRYSLIDAVQSFGADTVAVCDSADLTPRQLRTLGWEASERGLELIVIPSLTDVAGSRLHLEPIAGLGILHVAYPSLRGHRALLKRFIDIIGSAALLVLVAPILLAVAAAIALTSRGPILYRQERIGRDGRSFAMVKFRSMVPGADARLSELLAQQGSADQPLFKIENDPRTTPVGRLLRRYSLDELPQLLNVLGGSMSLVGPRPQREQEVALYDESAHRRLLVKPGMSGLWQVSGRSSLSWDESISLDLSYVENWSAVSDLLILAKTFRAVVAPGADAH